MGLQIFWLETRGKGDYIKFLDPKFLLRASAKLISDKIHEHLMEFISVRDNDLKLRLILKTITSKERPMVLILDEVQDFLLVMTSENIDQLGIMREVLRAKVLLILSGSIRTIMQDISRNFRERYFLQIRNLELSPFNLSGTWQFAEKILGEEISGMTVAILLRKSGGFPFYIFAIMDRAKELIRSYGIDILSAIDIAYIQEVFSSNGLIYEHCRYLWAEYLSYAKRKKYLRAILETLCTGPRSISELSFELNVDYNTIYKYADELVSQGLVIKENNILHIFNRTFVA